MIRKLCAAILLCSLSAPLLAEEADADAAATSDSTIIVTGTRQADAAVGVLGEKSVLETPFSIVTLDRQIITNQQAIVLSDVLKNDPSFTSGRNRGSFADSYYIRGFSALGNTFYDGVFGPAANSLLPPLEGIERVEILKGPATFLYGVTPNGGVGGSINLVPKRPSIEPVTDVTASFVERGQFGASADISRRFGVEDSIGLRANLAYRDGETTVRGVDEQYISGVLALSVDRGPFHLYADGGAFRRDIDGYQNGFSLANAAVPIPDAPNASIPYTSLYGFYDRDQYRGLVRAGYDLAEDWLAQATYSYTKIKGDYISPGLPTILNATGDYRVTLGRSRAQDSDLHSIDLQLRGKFETGPISHAIVAGGSRLWFDSLNELTVPIVLGTTNFANPVFGPRPIQPEAITTQVQDTRTDGVSFGDTLGFFDDQLEILLGVRHIKIKVFARNFSAAVPAGTIVTDLKNKGWTPLAAAVWRVTPQFTVYANYAEALERGGVAPVTPPRAGATQTNPNEAQSALETTSYEAGVKYDTGALLLSAAVFKIKKGLEINRDNQPITGANSFTYVQEGEQLHKGFEASGTGTVVKGLSLTGGVMYLDAKATRTATPAFNGRRAIGVPEWTVSLYGDWEPAFAPGLGLSAGIYYLSSQRYDLATTREIPGWTRFDLGARYGFEVGGRPVAARLAIDNVFDKNYWSSTINSTLTLGAPRTVKASVTVGL